MEILYTLICRFSCGIWETVMICSEEEIGVRKNMELRIYNKKGHKHIMKTESKNNKINMTMQDVHHVLAIENHILDFGYDFDSEADCIQQIVDNSIDISNYILPYNCKSIIEWQNKVSQMDKYCKQLEEHPILNREVVPDFLQRPDK